MILVSHDRAFLAAVVDHVLHLEGGSASAYVGGYAAFVMQREERRLTLQRQFDKQQTKISNEQDYIARNLAGQNTKQAKGRRKLLARMPRLSAPIGGEGTMALRLESSERGGDQVIVAEKVSISVPEVDGSERVLLENFSGRLTRGEVLGFLGPNGAGKSTLLKTLIGERPVASGDLKTGGSITAAYYRQDLAQVPMGRTLYDIIADLRPLWERRMVQGHLGRFGFSGDEAQRTADTLSGGERARVALAMMMLTRANLLILDEPTNHLDVETIEVLEDALTEYEGTIVLVSHDREMLRSLATRVWVLHDRHITDFDGTFGEWEIASAERAHAARVQNEEEEALRRVKEKQRTGRKDAPDAKRGQQKEGERDTRREQRNAQQALADAEQKVGELEGRVSKLATQLADPDLYTKPDGVERSKKIGKELDVARRELDRALDAWTASTEAVERWGVTKA